MGIALLNRLESRQGWLLSQVILAPDAPIGTSELLVSSVVKILSAE